jgi:hypothetical protein
MCLPLFPEADWPLFSATWPTSGSMRNGTCAPQPLLAERIAASASSYWPTATDADSRSSARHTTTTGVMHPSTMLTDAVRAWPTPTTVDDGTRCGRRQNPDGKGGHVLSEEATQWPTPAARDYKGENSVDHLTNGTGRKHLDQLPNFVAHLWATPNVPNGGRALDAETVASKGTDQNGQKHQVDLNAQVRLLWPTPAARYGSSQNGINGKGGEHERPSANTPGLEKLARTMTWPTPTTLNRTSDKAQNRRPTAGPQRGGPSLGLEDVATSRSFLPLLATSTDGDASSASDPISRRLWKTPHGFANTDQYGKTGGGGGEFHKQAMAASDSWSTPKANCNVTSTKAMTPFEDGGSTSKPGLAQQAIGSSTTKGKPKLNANFVEWLMGWPIGWTASALAATEWCRWRQRMRSSLWQLARASGVDSGVE